MDGLVEVCLITIAEVNSEIMDTIRAAYPEDRLFWSVIMNPERYPAYSILDGLIYHNEWLYISSDRTVQEALLTTYHDDQNHFDVSKTQGNLSHDFLWPGIMSDVEAYIQSCDSCAQNKSSTPASVEFLHPLAVSSNRFQEIALDFIGPLPESNGYDCILIMIDRLTDYVLIELMAMTATTPEIALLFYMTWYRRFGLPTAITLDCDKLFMSRF